MNATLTNSINGVLVDANLGSKMHLNRTAAMLGRAASSDIVIEDKLASREHALVIKMRGVFYIEDLDSTNGTVVNERKISERTALKPGDEIRIGTRRLVFMMEPSFDNADTEQLTKTQPGTAARPSLLRPAFNNQLARQ